MKSRSEKEGLLSEGSARELAPQQRESSKYWSHRLLLLPSSLSLASHGLNPTENQPGREEGQVTLSTEVGLLGTHETEDGRENGRRRTVSARIVCVCVGGRQRPCTRELKLPLV